MADAMLVFACGLIVALILSWNVDVTDQGIQKIPDSKYEVDNIDDNVSEEVTDETELEEMGTVYRDPKTGKYYVVEDAPSASESEAGESGKCDEEIINSFSCFGHGDVALRVWNRRYRCRFVCG